MLRRLSPIQISLAGFVLLALAGAFLLTLPVATRDARPQSFLDALFMATSAVSTTGLAVVSTGDFYTLFGQIVILALIQVGGLGYMTLIAFTIYLFGRNISFHSGTLIQESLAVPSRGEIREFVERVIVFTAAFEGIGALVLTFHWLPEFPLLQAAYLGLFHAISAFCTAGFSLFNDGFVAYQDDWFFNLVINIVSIGGAIGFFVLSEAQKVCL